jgi:type III restriction enzyme
MLKSGKITQLPSDTDIVQAPVDSPILCSPYLEPKEHWMYKEGSPVRTPGRRPASYFFVSKRVQTRQTSLFQEEQRDELELVNRLRNDVRNWRNTGYESATDITKKLLRHWSNPERSRRLFFCQLEAVETVIYLQEILRSGRKPRRTPEVSPDDFQKLLNGEKPSFATGINLTVMPTLADFPNEADIAPLIRHACKMATGSGKTVVMSMLLAWAFCNRGHNPTDERFPSAALIVCPNLTILERLQVLRPDLADNYYEKFNIVPDYLLPHLQQGKVMVKNWQSLTAEKPNVEGGKGWVVVDKGDESPDAFARRILGDLYQSAPILVLNDEGHHAYRPKPLTEAEASDLTEEEKNEREEATVWVTALDKINNSCGVRLVADLSATPFYIKGSGYIEGAPFPWITSDFGLTDAIESGIVKIPRVPVSDVTGRPEPKYFRLWEHINQDLKSGQKLPGGRPKPDIVWERAEDALQTLAGQYVRNFDVYTQRKEGELKIPPVMIVVCDNTNIAEEFYNRISGEEVQVITEEKKGRGGKMTTKKTKIVAYGTGRVQPKYFANREDFKPTLRIDTKLLADADTSDENDSKKEAAEKLRSIVSTVGQMGKPGEQVRCVVSVQMLTEGWDANNVTHILGLRAFGSQLLIEQVVGRGLRRMNYDVDENGLLPAEYVDVYGIPFSIIPFKGKSTRPGPDDDTPIKHIKALPERIDFEIWFPVVEGYVVDLKKNLIKADADSIPKLVLDPWSTPTAVFVKPQVGYSDQPTGISGDFKTELQDRQAYYDSIHLQTILFEITRLVVYNLTEARQDAKLRMMARHQLFPQVYRIVKDYVSSKIDFKGNDPREIGLQTYAKKIVERLVAAIEPDESSGEPPILPILNKFKQRGSTASVNFTTKKECQPTRKSHINQVVADTKTWEQSTAFWLEAIDEVDFYAKNDHLEFVIPYSFTNQPLSYVPDFLVRLKNGMTLILEIKGEEDEQDRAKYSGAHQWVKAVNNWGELGRWEFVVCKEPQVVREVVKAFY